MDFNNFVYALAICFALSFLIGIERQFRRRIIGLRTTILVSIGAFLFVSFSFSVGATDISRIASQVVTGIGFLGAGVIIKDGRKVRGLTTAATLWCDAAIGILCAGGAIKEAILGTVIILFSNIILRYVNSFINELSDKKHVILNYQVIIKGQSKDVKNIKNTIFEYFSKNQIEVKDINIKKGNLDTLTINILVDKNKYQEFQKLLDLSYDKYKFQTFNIKKIGEVKNEELDDEL